jgi:hypothetical protein
MFVTSASEIFEFFEISLKLKLEIAFTLNRVEFIFFFLLLVKVVI